ncbi:hypothetical protein L3Q65_11985 [Amycolatopsis sp. FU40]|uniref:hypothetical protein n=1 Tax=Amycolatopsis sp. FU40 TaxID=2914159 RepID=UPI001F26CB4D|nr:hypothetical protein [Amycolatopsis sp. FU40]UKD57406.1 hypothetical protein L3Q65_11985 [Amycolatopsis sp. FU40]
MTDVAFAWDRCTRAVLVDALARLDVRRFVVETRTGELAIARVGRLRHDPGGRHVLAGCGTALSAAWIVLRGLGIRPVLSFPCDPGRPDVVAAVTPGADDPATTSDWDRYLALRAVAGPPRGRAVPVEDPAVLAGLAGENPWPRTQVTPHAGSPGLAVTADGDSCVDRVLVGAAAHSLRVAAAVRGLTTEVRPGNQGRAPQAVVLVFES